MSKWLDGLRLSHLSFLVLVVMTAASNGCGRVGGYPEATIASPIGIDGVCVVCSKEISSVTKDNLVTISGNQFIVCDDECASQVEGVTEHAHSHPH